MFGLFGRKKQENGFINHSRVTKDHISIIEHGNFKDLQKSNPNNYIFLGGNQDDGVRFWTAPKNKIHNFCLFPIDYTGDLIPLELIEPSDFRAGAKKYEQGSTS